LSSTESENPIPPTTIVPATFPSTWNNNLGEPTNSPVEKSISIENNCSLSLSPSQDEKKK